MKCGRLRASGSELPGFSPKSFFCCGAFTLLEMLAVLAIIGLLATMAMPMLSNFRPNYTASATRQLLDDVGYARQLAISHHTTVLMVFVQTNFWTDPAKGAWRAADWAAATNLMEKQMVAYRMVSLRSLGDQPGSHAPRYLTEWKTLPEGAYIPWQMFAGTNVLTSMLLFTNIGSPAYRAYGFYWTSSAPFPLLDTPSFSLGQQYARLPYIAFDYLGRRCDDNGNPVSTDAIIPLSRGKIGFGRDPVSKTPLPVSPIFTEEPPGNATNSINLVYVDWLTGRARGVQPEVR
jgi:prepilin-type N-terminal cleavage/methylation domain-containing protein